MYTQFSLLTYHDLQRMIFLIEAHRAPGCGEVLSLGLPHIHVATAVGLLLIEFLLSLWSLVIITNNIDRHTHDN